MSVRFLFVNAVNPGDTLGDIGRETTEIAAQLGCRVVFHVGEFLTADERHSVAQQSAQSVDHEQRKSIASSPTLPVEAMDELDVEIEAEETSIESDSNSGRPFQKKMFGGITFVGSDYPTNDDIGAIQSEVARATNGLAPGASRILMINPDSGEYVIGAISGNQNARIFTFSEGDDPDDISQVFKMNVLNHKMVTNGLKSDLDGLSDQGCDLVIVCDPVQGDLAKYGRHVRKGGVFIYCTTDGSRPYIDDNLVSFGRFLTPSVFSVDRS